MCGTEFSDEDLYCPQCGFEEDDLPASDYKTPGIIVDNPIHVPKVKVPYETVISDLLAGICVLSVIAFVICFFPMIYTPVSSITAIQMLQPFYRDLCCGNNMMISTTLYSYSIVGFPFLIAALTFIKPRLKARLIAIEVLSILQTIFFITLWASAIKYMEIADMIRSSWFVLYIGTSAGVIILGLLGIFYASKTAKNEAADNATSEPVSETVNEE